jgi:hypothetical protein
LYWYVLCSAHKNGKHNRDKKTCVREKMDFSQIYIFGFPRKREREMGIIYYREMKMEMVIGTL